jgi:DNA-binding NarL/FixJ family response regulator
VRIEATGPDLAAAARFERRPTLVIVRRSPGGSSLEEVVTWTRRVVHSAVLVVVPDVEADEVADLLSLGADGLLLEHDLEAALAPVVRSLVSGQVSIPAVLRELVQPPGLTHREREVLALALAGLSNAEIGRRLVISANTVRSHLASAFRRLGVPSRRELARPALVSDEVLRTAVQATPRLLAHDALREGGA